MKNIFKITILCFALSSCSSIKTGYSNSATTIIEKDFDVLGNVRIEIASDDYKYDSLMKAAIEKYGENIDIINIKADYPLKFSIRDKTIYNALVIRFKD